MTIITDYTKSLYRHINRNLLKGVVTPEAVELTNALSQIAPVSGTTFRGMNIDEIETYFSNLSKGSVLKFDTFMSTSKSQNVAAQFGNVQFTINGKSGRDVARYSDVPAEQEVLFPAGCEFVVIKIKAVKIAGRVFKLEITLNER